MNKKWIALLLSALPLLQIPGLCANENPPTPTNATARGFTDAAAFGFSPDASGVDNTKALQHAVDQAGTITVSRPGIYKVAGTIFVGGHTKLIFGNDVFLKKVAEQGAFTHVILNKGALTKTYDEDIAIEGLQIIVNGVDVRNFGRLWTCTASSRFFMSRTCGSNSSAASISAGRSMAFMSARSRTSSSTMSSSRDKDGVHLGRGKHFTIRNGAFQTGDDAVALNAHDYAVGNPELGWIEDGVVENCHDLNAESPRGYFCRILAGAWIDWQPGMEVQQSDTVVSGGKT